MKFLTVLLVLLILFLALTPSFGINTYPFHGADKIKHITAFFVLSFFLFYTFKNQSFILKFIILVCFAALIEILQLFTKRESSFEDFLFSVVGIGLYLIFRLLINKNIKS